MIIYNNINVYLTLLITIIISIDKVNAFQSNIHYNNRIINNYNNYNYNYNYNRNDYKLQFSLIDIVGNIDQFIQGALNSATDTAPLIASQPATTQIPELNILTSVDAETGLIKPLGNDLLIFLCATIGIVPLFKWLKASPVIGFLSAGLLMGPAGLKLFSDLNDMESLADFGVLFLLFEQGLELTVDRLKSLSTYAFGMGTLQVILCTAAFFIFPFIGGVQFLEFFVHSQANVVDITRVDEALVIGAALSLSSSAFVLKILQEKGQLSTKFGAASLGILLLQDIAVVPLLVLLPIIESNSGPMPLSAQLTLLGATFLKALVGLGGILVIGGKFVRYLFSLIAQTRSSETFVALCLLVALGTGALTDQLGLSSTLGAFTAGTLLAESNYRTQIESDIKPFRGLLLGLFFLTTGASVDPTVIQEQFPTVLALLGGLITFKAVIISLLGPYFGLSKAESVRTGFILSGGGEFAFVVLTLADKLQVLPDQLAKILVGVVVLSMALTPYLSMLGDKAAEYIDSFEGTKKLKDLEGNTDVDDFEVEEVEDNSDVIVICGFGHFGENIARVLSNNNVMTTLNSNYDREVKYIAFDLDPNLVVKGFKEGKKVLYGDGSQPPVLSTAGIETPRAVVVTYSDPELCFKSVERLREAYPSTPILTRASDMSEYYHLLEAGATKAIPDEREVSLMMASALLENLGLPESDVKKVEEEIRMDLLVEDNEKIEFNKSLKKGLAMNTIKNDNGRYADIVISRASEAMNDIFGTARNIYLFGNKSKTMIKNNDINSEIDELGVKVCPLPSKSDRE